MSDPGLAVELSQRNVCLERGCDFEAACVEHSTGVALSTLGGTPINGLRHPPSQETTGWYIWCRESFSDSPDFFTPLCVDHLLERLPSVASLLGLPAGYRFIVSDGYLDIWFDQSLLKV